MNKAMFVITHKKIENKIPLNNFYYLGVGNSESNADYHDNSLDNIANKNKNYCELTGLYWIWKNISCSEVGLCHYRRFFCKIEDSQYSPLTIDELSNLLKTHDIVVAKKINVYMDYFTFYEKCLRNNALRKCCDLIVEKDESYKFSIEKLLNQKYNHCFNMFYCKKELIDEYCKWIFDILFEFENKVDMTGWSAQQRRVYGFIGEFLLNVWIEHKGLNFVEVDVAQSEVYPAPLSFDAESAVVHPGFIKKLAYGILPQIWPLLSRFWVKNAIKETK